MSRDEQEEEREFLAELKARTGHDLATWMAAITAQDFADKNDTIDWLRAQGFPFARASWLERIHSNGGKPIYLDDAAAGSAPQPPPAPPLAKVAPAARAATPRELAQLEKLLAAAKGYRPLYQLLEAEIRRAAPGATLIAKASYVSVGAPREFAAITLHATELRLGLDLGDHPVGGDLQKARLKGPGAGITHMVVLTDARQVNGDLLGLIKAANARVNS